MPEISADLAAPRCFLLHSESGIEENQSFAPDLFAFCAPALAREDTLTRDADGRFAKGHSGNPEGRPRGIPNPKRRVVTLQAWRANPEACKALFHRQPWQLRRLLAQILPPAQPIDPAERIGLRIASVRTPEQVWRALDKAFQAASRGEIAPAEAARIMRRIEARLRAERRRLRKAAAPAACRPSGSRPSGLKVRPAVRGERR